MTEIVSADAERLWRSVNEQVVRPWSWRLGASQAQRRRMLEFCEIANVSCSYCATVLGDDGEGGFVVGHLDHIIPKSRGGSNLPANLAPSCKACNLSKSAKTPDEWEWRRAA